MTLKSGKLNDCNIYFSFIIFRDSSRIMTSYTPIACIEFQGSMSRSGDSGGHYVCDIKSYRDGKWLRTNDNDAPEAIDESQVSNLPYIVLYKRI